MTNILAISEDGLLCQSREQYDWQGCRSLQAVKKGITFNNNYVFAVEDKKAALPRKYEILLFKISGKFYYEATVTDEGLCRVGWSTRDATFNLGIRLLFSNKTANFAKLNTSRLIEKCWLHSVCLFTKCVVLYTSLHSVYVSAILTWFVIMDKKNAMFVAGNQKRCCINHHPPLQFLLH